VSIPNDRPAATTSADVDVVVIGAGFGGLYAVHRFRSDGLSVRGFERAPDVGGTWYWNRYPGCRCDIESIYYSYSFSEELQQEWTWTHRYATQGEILRYLRYVADRFDLRKEFTFNTSVTSAVFDDEQVWTVSADNGEVFRARFVLMATGPLSTPIDPKIPGLADFAGVVARTSQWPDDLDLEGKRVGIIGTGSSGIQSAPVIAEQAAHLYVFQRTAQYSIPAWNRAYTEEEIARIKAEYPQMRRDAWETVGGIIYEQPDHDPLTASSEQREAWLEKAWQRGGYLMLASYPNVIFDERVNAIVGEFVKKKIRAKVHDPELKERLTPSYPFGAKRLCADTNYFETFNRDDVTLVDIKENPIDHVDAHGIVLQDGSRVDLDVIILAIGFHAFTGTLLKMEVRGRGGLTIQEKWANSTGNYLGFSIAGFPNLFMVNGPGSVGVLYNMVPASEQHVDFVADTIAYLDSHGLASIEPSEEAERNWCAHLLEIADQTIYPKANTWYMGDNVPGKPREFLAYAGGGPAYFAHFEKEASNGYPGFVLRKRG